MQLKDIYIILLGFIMASCGTNDRVSEEIQVIGTIYKAMPKVIPPPPPVKEDLNPEIINPDFFLKHKYAIFQGFIDVESTDFTNVFYNHEYVSGELFKEVQIDSISIKLARSLSKLNYGKHIKKKKLNEYVKEDLIYLNNRFVIEEKKEEQSINGIMSFSRVAFDKEFKKAAICVGIHYDKLSSSETIYILEKVNDEWIIKFTEVGETS